MADREIADSSTNATRDTSDTKVVRRSVVTPPRERPGDAEGSPVSENDDDALTAPRLDPSSLTKPAPDLISELEAPVTPAKTPPVDVDGPPPAAPGEGIISSGGSGRRGDKIFFGLTAGASGLIILIVLLVAAFLLIQSIPSILDDKVNFFTAFDWSTDPGDLRFGIARLLWVTVIISALALLIAVPLAIGIALFITQYAPRRLAQPVAFAIDLLAAIPSIVYGIWGATILAPKLTPVQNVLDHLSFIPLFTAGFGTGTIFDGGVVLAVMVLPIVTAISRDVFDRTPTAHVEAALALGATKWEMIRTAVLPYGRPGVISGSMLGLGRALGETLAIYFIVSTTANFNFSIFNGGETFASKIANNQAEFGLHPGPYIAAGLVLFVLTFLVNAAARFIVNRRKDFV